MTKQIITKKVYTVKEISEMISIPVQTIKNQIRKLYPNKMQVGIITYLDEIEVSQISKLLKKAHNSNLSITGQVVMTEYEELEIVANAITIMQRKIKELQPKAESFDKFISTENHISIGEFAKTINIGRNKCFEMLRENGIIDGKNIPYQKYMQYFIVRQIEKNGILFPTAFINSKGIEYLTKAIK